MSRLPERYSRQRWWKFEGTNTFKFQIPNDEELAGIPRWQKWDNINRKFTDSVPEDREAKCSTVRLLKGEGGVYYCYSASYSINKQLSKLVNDLQVVGVDWRDILFCVTRTGTGMETRYDVRVDKNLRVASTINPEPILVPPEALKTVGDTFTSLNTNNGSNVPLNASEPVVPTKPADDLYEI